MIDHFSHRARSLSLVSALCCSLLLALLGCGDSGGGQAQPQQVPDYDFNLELEARSASDNGPVAGVPIRVDGNVVGFTDANGKFRGVLRDQPGKEIELGFDEPEGYRLMTEGFPRTADLQITRALDGGYRGIPIRMSAEFHVILLEYLTWVELSCDDKLADDYCRDVPVLMDGQEVGRTNHNGFTHFVFRGLPGETHEVRVDTPRSDSVNMQPANPTYQIELERKATIFHLNQEFTDPDARPARRRPARRATPRPTPRPTPQPQAEEDDSGSSVIPLF